MPASKIGKQKLARNKVKAVGLGRREKRTKTSLAAQKNEKMPPGSGIEPF
jgi:hypothetical protein